MTLTILSGSQKMKNSCRKCIKAICQKKNLKMKYTETKNSFICVREEYLDIIQISFDFY